MDQNSLVALVTQLVMEELSKPSLGAAATDSASPLCEPSREFLICGAPGSACEQAAFDAMRLFTDVRWLIVDWVGYPAERMAKGLGVSLGDRRFSEVITPPELWDDLVRRAEAVILPFAPLDVLAKMAVLMVDTPPVSASLAGLIQGVPVLFGADDAERLSRFSARITRGVVSVAQDHVRAVQGMGVIVETPTQLVGHMTGGVAALVSSSSGGRDVVTNEDVMAAMQAGKKAIEVTAGSIVTSLARESAERFGIEVRFR